MTHKEFIKLVRKKIIALKKNATKKQLSRLDFETFNPYHYCLCIYGQMTGFSLDEEAKKLTKKIFLYLSSFNSNFNCPYFQFTALELYVAHKGILDRSTLLKNDKDIKMIFKYLKGEIKTLRKL